MRKDRTERTQIRKVSKHLKAAVVIVSVFTALFSAFSVTSLVLLSNSNNEISQRINDYTERIDSLETSQNEILLKYQGNAD